MWNLAKRSLLVIAISATTALPSAALAGQVIQASVVGVNAYASTVFIVNVSQNDTNIGCNASLLTYFSIGFVNDRRSGTSRYHIGSTSSRKTN